MSVCEGDEVIEFRRRVTDHADLLKFDPENLVKQLPMIQTNDELFGSTPTKPKAEENEETDGNWDMSED